MRDSLVEQLANRRFLFRGCISGVCARLGKGPGEKKKKVEGSSC
jgi:hypothetical protein